MIHIYRSDRAIKEFQELQEYLKVTIEKLVSECQQLFEDAQSKREKIENLVNQHQQKLTQAIEDIRTQLDDIAAPLAEKLAEIDTSLKTHQQNTASIDRSGQQTHENLEASTQHYSNRFGQQFWRTMLALPQLQRPDLWAICTTNRIYPMRVIP